MTTYIAFQPRPRAPFTFQPVLDGAARRAELRWSLFGQAWRVLSIYSLTGQRVVTTALVGSPDPAAVASASYDATRGRVVVGTVAPHGLDVGSVVALVFRGFTPATYNAFAVDCVVLDGSTLAYDSATDPGAATILGSVGQEFNLVSGYYGSSLVYRASANRFEVD